MSADWFFCQRPECKETNQVVGLRDLAQARRRLQRFKIDNRSMLSLRALLWLEGSVHLQDLSDDAVIDQVAALLLSGVVHAHATSGVTGVLTPSSDGVEFGGFAVTPGQGGSGVSEQAAAAVVPSPSRAPSGPAAPPPDAPIFDSGLNESAQAEALAAAAEDGRPFCPQ